MAQFEIKIGATVLTIPDHQLPRVRSAFLKWRPVVIDDDGNPTTDVAEHFENIFGDWITEIVQRMEKQEAQKAVVIDTDDLITRR